MVKILLVSISFWVEIYFVVFHIVIYKVHHVD